MASFDLTNRHDADEAQRIYNAIFPYYAEVCVVTQYHKKGAAPGGWGGHAGMFMNGAEIEPRADYPRLRLVWDPAALAGPDSGTGISVNQIFRNVNWVAIPGGDEFFRGGVAPEQTLDRASYEAAVSRATGAGWLRGIEIRHELMRQRPAAMPIQEFIVRHSIGTDFALNFARTAYCARLPLSRGAMGKVIEYLNGVNEAAQNSGYTWNAYTNNCSHVVHNALAAAGVWDAKEARGPGVINVMRDIVSVARAVALGRMSDFSFPANSLVRAYEAGNERPIDGAGTAFKNHDVVRTLKDGWISTGPGALIVTNPMHDAARNQMFAPGRDPFLFSVPRLWDKEDTFKMLTRHARPSLTDLGANLARFRDRYTHIVASKGSVNDELPSVEGDENAHDFPTFYDRFHKHIAEELQRTDARIVHYERLAGVAT